ncbi:hypothetical protein ABEB36_001998 [Hypothenemus hampei]|uniref:Uncharacterized protein n=1 Tax=Hypothenemus hampei TaxID=57062 RepID=A0ABD1FIB4_HYPHA
MEHRSKHIFKGSSSRYPQISKTIGQAFFDVCEQNPKKIFQIDGATGIQYSYGDVKLMAIRLGLTLKRQHCICTGDMAMVIASNNIENIIPILACLFLGIKAVSIDPSTNVQELADAMFNTRPKLCLFEKDYEQLVHDAFTKSLGKAEYKVPFLASPFTNIEKLDEEEKFELYPSKPLDTALYVFTSGTTSSPKPVAFSHFAILNGFRSLVDEIDNVRPTMITHFSSLYWISAILLTGLSIGHGGAKILASHMPAYFFLKSIELYKITFAFMSNTFTYQLTSLSEKAFLDHATSSLYSIIIGGSSMDPIQLKKIRKLFPDTKITVGYGSSECSAVSAFNLRDTKAYEEKLLSSGQLLPDVEVKIVDLQTRQPLGTNATGEILVRSPYIMNGYHECCTATLKVPYDSDNFLLTGDLGYFDDDHYLYVIDRINDMFKYQTYQVSPLIIERQLCAHPAVREAVVFNVYHEKDRNHAVAIVVLKQNSNKVTETELLHFANGVLSEKNQIRGGLKIVDEIPFRTQSGKVQRVKIKQQFAKYFGENCEKN